MWIRFPGGAAPRGGRPVASEQRWALLVCDDHCSLPANHSTNESCVNAVRQWRVLAAKGSGAVDILFAARPSGDAMPTTRDAASARMGKERMELGYSNGLRPGYERASPYDVWVEGRYSGFDDDAASLGRDGHVGVLYVGGDYRVAENMMVGALVQFDWSKDASDVLQSSVDGNGGMAGPYLSMRAAPPPGTASAPPATPATRCRGPSTCL
jgi:hypothetical protein